MADFDILSVGAVHFLVDFARYVIPAGIFFFIFYKIGAGRFYHRRIQTDRSPNPKRMRREFLFSVITVVIFACQGIFVTWSKMNGMTLVYTDIAEYGWLYFGFSIVIYIILHDCYFYWSHRAMHSKGLYRLFHSEHHRSVNPSPWAAYAFHPLEALVNAIVLPLLVFAVPAHPLALFVFLLHMIIRNVIGHLGYEMYPAGFTRGRFFKHITTAVHHDLHHRRGRAITVYILLGGIS